MAATGLEWAWGKGQFDGKVMLFDDKFSAGGYKCCLCSIKLDKRFDNLTKHLKTLHEDLTEDERKIMVKGIPRIKIRCKFCKFGFDLTGAKEARHFAVCPAREKSYVDSPEMDNRLEERTQPVKMASHRRMKVVDYRFLAGMKEKENVNTLELASPRSKDMSKEREQSVEIIKEKEPVKKFSRRSKKVVDYRFLAGKKPSNVVNKIVKGNMEIGNKVAIDVQEKSVHIDLGHKEGMKVNKEKVQSEEVAIPRQKKVINYRFLAGMHQHTSKPAKRANEMCINRDQGVKDITPVWREVRKMEGKVMEANGMKETYEDVIKELKNAVSGLEKDKEINENERKKLKAANEAMKTKNDTLVNKVKEMKRKLDNGSKIDKLEFRTVKTLKTLGQGSFGKVRKAEYKGEILALKEMALHWTTLIDLAVMLKVNSDNLIGATCIGIDWNQENLAKSKITIGMECCDYDLHTLLNRKRGEKRDTAQSKSWKCNVMDGAGKALDQLHSIPIIHRDIKPENLLIKNQVVKLGDFGLAELGNTGYTVSGTPGYIAPEVLDCEKLKTSYSTKADIWSMGAVMHELLVDEYLVKDASNDKECHEPKQMWEDTEQSLKQYAQLCKRMLEKNPKDRISAHHFVSKFDAIRK